MKIIISPAKKMKKDSELFLDATMPVFLEKAKKMAEWLQLLSLNELQNLLGCNTEIAQLNYNRYSTINFSENLSHALLAYDGIQYKYMAPLVFDYTSFAYVEKHVRILSGLYGVLRPLDGIAPYRLEMQAKVKTDFCKNLYDYWGDALYNELTQNDDIILNLASKEYSRVVEHYLTADVRFINCVFGEIVAQGNGDDKIVEKGVYVKMARGEMVRFMAEQNITKPDNVKNFEGLGFHYNQKFSQPNTFVFTK